MDEQSDAGAFLWAFGGKVMSRNEDGVPELTFYNEHVVNIYSKLYITIRNTAGLYSAFTHGTGITTFAQGNAVFALGTIDFARFNLADYENDFGILVLPKYDENQEKYYTYK